MKKSLENPEVQVIFFTKEDVVTASPFGTPDEDELIQGKP